MNINVSNPAASSAVNLRDLVSPRGVRFWLVEDYAVPLVALEFGFRGGSSQDPAGKAGALTMLAGLLDEGAGELDDRPSSKRSKRKRSNSPSIASAITLADG